MRPSRRSVDKNGSAPDDEANVGRDCQKRREASGPPGREGEGWEGGREGEREGEGERGRERGGEGEREGRERERREREHNEGADQMKELKGRRSSRREETG